MPKTFIGVVSYRFVIMGSPVIIPLGTSVEGFFVWNFEIVSLGFIWDLFFGAWKFQFFVE
jgi:hypothetical protein